MGLKSPKPPQSAPQATGTAVRSAARPPSAASVDRPVVATAPSLDALASLTAVANPGIGARIRVEELVPLPGKHLPKDYKSAVAMLVRPYIEISEEQYQQIVKMTEVPQTDIVRLKDGRQATFGDADVGYALMPLAKPI